MPGLYKALVIFILLREIVRNGNETEPLILIVVVVEVFLKLSPRSCAICNGASFGSTALADHDATDRFTREIAAVPSAFQEWVESSI